MNNCRRIGQPISLVCRYPHSLERIEFQNKTIHCVVVVRGTTAVALYNIWAKTLKCRNAFCRCLVDIVVEQLGYHH